MTRCLALIPARGGSKRVPGKNVRLLNGRPLIAYTVSAALESGEFDKALVSSDDPNTLEIAHRYGADVLHRPEQFATDTSPDIEWVSHALSVLGGSAHYDTFSILRPTSPFRTPATIRRAFSEWRNAHENGECYSSLRAVEKCGQHPGKMWRIHGRELVSLLLQPHNPVAATRVIPTEAEGSNSRRTGSSSSLPTPQTQATGQHRPDVRKDTVASHRSDPSASVGMTGAGGMTRELLSPALQPWHDSQYAALPAVYVQNASLEIAWIRTVEETGTISGPRILPFLTQGHEGLDVNTEMDWTLAEILLEKNRVALPSLAPPDERRTSVA